MDHGIILIPLTLTVVTATLILTVTFLLPLMFTVKVTVPLNLTVPLRITMKVILPLNLTVKVTLTLKITEIVTLPLILTVKITVTVTDIVKINATLLLPLTRLNPNYENHPSTVVVLKNIFIQVGLLDSSAELSFAHPVSERLRCGLITQFPTTALFFLHLISSCMHGFESILLKEKIIKNED